VDINRLPASKGLAWFAGSVALFRSQPARLLLIGLVLQFLMGFTQAGALGLLLVLAIPVLTAGVMQAMSMVERGLTPPLMTLFCAFSESQKTMRLFILGLVVIAVGLLCASFLLSGAVQSMDADFLAKLEQGDIEALTMADPLLIQRLAIALIVGLMVSGSIAYFSVPLIWFHNLSVGTAILEGLVGMLKNWAAFLVLGGLMALVFVPVAMVTSALLLSTTGGGALSTILTLLMLLMMVAYQLLVFGSQFMSFRDVFGTGKEEPDGQHDDNQLVA
jgi:hypothetical protein